MRFLLLFFLLSVLSFSQCEFDASLTSGYVRRVFSQTEGEPAFQFDLGWEHTTGFYLGRWSSTVNFDEVTDFEIDTWVGYHNEFENDLHIELGYLHYVFEDGFGKAYLDLSLKEFSTNYFCDFGNENTYPESDYSWCWSEKWESSLHMGHYNLNSQADNVLDWSLRLGFEFEYFQC